MAASASFLYPLPSEAALKLEYVGKRIQDVPAPAVIIDSAVVRRNCKLMLDSAERLGVRFRAHVKTHKTVEMSKLQVGEDSDAINLVASTISEIEMLLPWLFESKQKGNSVSVMYGLPLSPGAVPRLSAIARILGKDVLGVFVDHPDQVKLLDLQDELTWPGPIPVFVNIDIGYHREGISAQSQQLADIAYALAASTRARLFGLYSHYGSSYNVSSPAEALKDAAAELNGLEEAAVQFLKCTGANKTGAKDAEKVVLSIGATPTVTALQNLFEDEKEFQAYRALLERLNQSFAVELHAGVYPVMDMQQLATRARPLQSQTSPGQTLLSFQDLGLRTLVEVASLYPDRGQKPEALIAAGSIVLGREPCKSYPGWSVVSPWPVKTGQFYDPEGTRTGWIVGRIAQEHGILTWEGDVKDIRTLRVGEKLLLWPNHACIAGASFGWFLITNGASNDPERIVDVWLRCRGW